MLAIFGAAHRIIRKVLANPDLIEHWRKALGLPGKSAPAAAPVPAPRTADAARRTAAPSRRPVPGAKPPRRQARAADDSPNDWYLLLDVSPDADRREISDALKRRIARARADNDKAAMQRLLRAAATGIRQPRRATPGGYRIVGEPGLAE